MGGSKQTQTTEATRDPWAPAQPLLQDIIKQAQQYGNDPSRFTPTFSDATRQSMQGLQDMGSQPLAQADTFRRLADGTMAGYDAGQSTLMQTASGGMMGGNNPHLDRVLATARGNAADSVNAQFSGLGRHGSGSHAGVLADKLGNIETTARLQDYDQERTRQLNAAGLLHNAGLNSGQYAAGVDGAETARLGLLGQAGSMQDQMDAAVRGAPMQATQWMAGLGIPIAGLGGSQNSTSTTHTPANIPGMIGSAAMTGLGVMTGNPSAIANLGSNVGAMFRGPSPVGQNLGSPFFSNDQMKSMGGYF
jgi:hypothetical protein